MTDYVLEFIEAVTERFIFDTEDVAKIMNIGVQQSRAAFSSVVFKENLPSVYMSVDGRWLIRLAELLLEQAAQTRSIVCISLSLDEKQVVISIGDEATVDNGARLESSAIDGKLSAALLVCDQIAKVHGGRLWLSPSNHFINFYFSLPLENQR